MKHIGYYEGMFTCGCGLRFAGEGCRSCVGHIKAYLCTACGARIENPFWSGLPEHNIIRKVLYNGELAQ
jgi:hypothetical protein